MCALTHLPLLAAGLQSFHSFLYGLQLTTCSTAGQGVCHGVRQPRVDSDACARHVHSPCSPGALFCGLARGHKARRYAEKRILLPV